jgi:hypothetical protein
MKRIRYDLKQERMKDGVNMDTYETSAGEPSPQ